MPFNLKLDGFLDSLERVQILNFDLDAESCASFRPDRNVRVAAKAPFLHVAITDAEVLQNLSEGSEVGTGFLWTSDIRFTDDLEQRHAGAIQVHQAGGAVRIMNVLTGVFLDVNAGQANSFLSSIDLDVDITTSAYGQFVLANLIALGQIGIKIVFTSKDARRCDRAVGSQACFDCKLNDLFVEHRQNSRKSGAYRAGVLIRFATELGRTTAEDLRLCEQLGVNFESNDRFVFHKVRTSRMRRIENSASEFPPLILELWLLLVPWGRLLVLMRDAEDCRFIEVFANQLDADGHAILVEAAGERQCR